MFKKIFKFLFKKDEPIKKVPVEIKESAKSKYESSIKRLSVKERCALRCNKCLSTNIEWTGKGNLVKKCLDCDYGSYDVYDMYLFECKYYQEKFNKEKNGLLGIRYKFYDDYEVE